MVADQALYCDAYAEYSPFKKTGNLSGLKYLFIHDNLSGSVFMIMISAVLLLHTP